MRYGTPEWIAKYFPEYLIGGDPIRLSRGAWPIKATTSTKETAPWRYLPNIPDGETPNHNGEISVPGKKGYGREVVRILPDDELQAYFDGFNYFRNGHQGINPLLLVGGRKIFRKAYRCPQGDYYEGGKDTRARFVYHDGTEVIGL